MRQLLKQLFILALVPILGASAAMAAAPKDAKKSDSGKGVIPVFRLSGSLSEAPAEDSFPFGGGNKLSFRDVVTRLKKAGKDHAVKAIVLLVDAAPGQAQTEELRQVMGHIRQSGKEIFVHADSLTMGEYLLVSGASRVSLVPTADVWLTGLHGEAPYLRGLLDKLGVQPDYLHCGDYKSAGEIFMREGPSPEAEHMQNWLLDSLYESDVKLIATGRGVDAAKVKSWIDGGPYTAEKAKTAGIIDAVEHRQDFTAMLKSKFGSDVVFNHKYGNKDAPSIDFSSPFAMFKVLGDLMNEAKKDKKEKASVGIVYVEGGIALGGGGQVSPFGMAGALSSNIRKALDDAAKDDSIKAVVLRVDSPGGSAVASEIILDATRRVKAKKPFVVSMGNVAGSGGYYVACASDVIFADEATITGSIGVVGGKFATKAMWKKIGVTFKSYQRGKNADMLSSDKPFSPDERQKMQSWMDDIYNVFKGHVVAIRGGKLKKPIDELAGGRVYTGKQALELGLVDRIGTMQDAIAYIAKEAKLSEYETRVVPEPKNFIEQLIEEASGGKNDPGQVELGRPAATASYKGSLVDLALPYLKDMDPARVSSVVKALEALQLLQREGVLMLMPEYTFAR